MKRVVLLMILALISLLGASVGLSQNWSPPQSAMPQTGVPMPVMGPQGPAQPFDPSCCPPPPCPPTGCPPVGPCMPAPCGPCKKASLGAIVGWQWSKDIGGLKFSAEGKPSFAMTGQKIDFKLDGIWAGLSARTELSDCVSARIEIRHLFPSNSYVDTTTALSRGEPGQRKFGTCKYEWNVLDASAAINLACGVSAIGGFRWDSFYVFMSHPPLVNLYSNPTDQGDLTINCYQPYAGAEVAVTGCDSGFLFRIVGSPWVPTNMKYGMTFGPGGSQTWGLAGLAAGGTPSVAWIRDHMQVNSKWGSFIEASVHCGKKVADGITVGAFALINNTTANYKGKMKSNRNTPVLDLSEGFDVDLNRRAFAVGGNIAVSVQSPL